MSEKIIKVNNLEKTFKVSKRAKGLPGFIANLIKPSYNYLNAVRNISFEINKGEAVGFIGSNGAGKSTTIKMLSGIIYPDAGSIEVNGYIPYKNRKQYVSKIGVVFGQKSQLSWDLPVIDSFELLKNIYRIPEEKYKANLKKFTDLLDLSAFIEQPVRQLSLGQRMRADIAAALLHSPELVFFDEPTIGLDVLAKERIREFIRYINKEHGVTMIFTTHDMQDIEKTCNRIILINKGSIIYDGGINDILKKYANERKLIVEFADDFIIEPIQNVQIISKDKYVKEFNFKSSEFSAQQLINELSGKYDMKDLKIEDMDIEILVRQIYEGGIKLS